MMQIGLVFPLAQNFVRPPPSPGPASDWAADPMLFVYVMGALLLGILVLLLIRRRTRVPDFAGQAILVDGSNVMHWQDNTPSLDPLQQVVRELSLLGTWATSWRGAFWANGSWRSVWASRRRRLWLCRRAPRPIPTCWTPRGNCRPAS